MAESYLNVSEKQGKRKVKAKLDRYHNLTKKDLVK